MSPFHLRFAILASLGVLQGCPGAAGPGPEGPAVDPPLEQAEGLMAEKAWTRSLETWSEAAEIASGARGAYPFDEKGKERILERLSDSREAVEELEGRGLISTSEAGLLIQDVDFLVQGVREKRPKEMELATCYQPMMYMPRQESLQRLAPRVALLEGMLAQESLEPLVVERVLVKIEEDLAILTGDDGYPLGPEEKASAEETASKVRAAVDALRARLGGGAPPPPAPPADESSQVPNLIPEATESE